ncbi:MAG: MMPL family transporter [Desulfatitalea sp.]|nr:MMPL family transporter [Desulfatitalea sp.]NNJ98771.1 MMPL family transporter [Desulfatitalea sp.]
MKSEKIAIDELCRTLTKHRVIILVGILIVTGVFVYGAFHIRGHVEIGEMFPYDHPYMKLTAKFSQVFGSGSSSVLIAMQTKEGDIFNTAFLEKLKNMTREVELWEEVNPALTSSIASLSAKAVMLRAGGEIAVAPLYYYKTPETAEEMALLKKRIFTSPSFKGTLVARDGTAALLATSFMEGVPYDRIHLKLQKLVKDYSDQNISIHIVGFPSLMGWIYSLKSQILYIFLLSIVAMIVVLVLIFQGSLVGMVAVMGSSLILTAWGLGFIGFAGINFSPLLYVLAFLVGARMIGNAHQIAYRYFEELDSANGDKSIACYEAMRTMWIPNIAAVAADVAGFAVLFVAKIVLMQHLAVIMSFWMATIALTGLLVPVLSSLLPWKVDTAEWQKDKCHEGFLANSMMFLTRYSIRNKFTRYSVALVVLAVTIAVVWQAKHLKVGDPSPGSPILAVDHRYNQDQRIVNSKFDRTSDSLALYYQGEPGTATDTAVLNTFEKFSRHMKERLPDIYKSSLSINDTMKSISLMWHEGDVAWDQLSKQSDVLKFCISYYCMQAGGSTTSSFFMDAPHGSAQTFLFFADHTSDNLIRIRDAAYAYFKTHPAKIETGEFILAGGTLGMEMAINESMKKYHVLIDAMIYSALFLIMALIYRSIVAGLMLTLPLVLSNGIAAAYMSLTGMGLSINTLPVFAIGAGVGIDFAIYLYSRAIEEYPNQNGDWINTITQSICTCGKAVVYTALTIILPIITWYFFSDFKFQADVGFFLTIIMLTNVILTVTLHPLMIYVIKPKFISGGAQLKKRRPIASCACSLGGAKNS